MILGCPSPTPPPPPSLGTFCREFPVSLPHLFGLGSCYSLSSSFLGLPYRLLRILNINHKKELLKGLWVKPEGHVWNRTEGKEIPNASPDS